jgi:hypothetical protein
MGPSKFDKVNRDLIKGGDEQLVCCRRSLGAFSMRDEK